MGLLAIGIFALAGWLIVTGRLQRMTAKDGMMLGVALVGAILMAKGRPAIGALPVAVAALYAHARTRRTTRRTGAGKAAAAPAGFAEAVEIVEARELLGLGRDADVEAIRAAHRRLIALAHPDRGGTEALARQINAARDLLLRHYGAR